MEQTSFNQAANQFTENPENRCPSVLILDISGSMQGEPIKQLQDGIAIYRDSLAADSLAQKRVDVAIVTFGGTVEVVQSFTNALNFTTPTLAAHGDTPMGEAIVTALKMLEDRKTEYKNGAIQYYRPWVFLITDGGPTDVDTNYWTDAKNLIKSGEGKKFSFFAVGVEGANMDRLSELSPARSPLKLQGLEFRKLFEWLSGSQKDVSKSNPGDKVALKDPTAGPNGWAQV